MVWNAGRCNCCIGFVSIRNIQGKRVYCTLDTRNEMVNSFRSIDKVLLCLLRSALNTIGNKRATLNSFMSIMRDLTNCPVRRLRIVDTQLCVVDSGAASRKDVTCVTWLFKWNKVKVRSTIPTVFVKCFVFWWCGRKSCLFFFCAEIYFIVLFTVFYIKQFL